ncbi:hypothetical protein [Microtetraspora malaysiensis]|uniref:hypothetical protein n=1 Tax=Microtetraspora malaysiensis TaxID=161358 RepID=UPI003D91E0E4
MVSGHKPTDDPPRRVRRFATFAAFVTAGVSACASKYETDYLLTGALPPAGTVCKQDSEPFPEPPAR